VEFYGTTKSTDRFDPAAHEHVKLGELDECTIIPPEDEYKMLANYFVGSVYSFAELAISEKSFENTVCQFPITTGPHVYLRVEMLNVKTVERAYKKDKDLKFLLELTKELEKRKLGIVAPISYPRRPSDPRHNGNASPHHIDGYGKGDMMQVRFGEELVLVYRGTDEIMYRVDSSHRKIGCTFMGDGDWSGGDYGQMLHAGRMSFYSPCATYQFTGPNVGPDTAKDVVLPILKDLSKRAISEQWPQYTNQQIMEAEAKWTDLENGKYKELPSFLEAGMPGRNHFKKKILMSGSGYGMGLDEVDEYVIDEQETEGE